MVVCREEFFSKTEARRREHELKSYKGNDRFKRLYFDGAKPAPLSIRIMSKPRSLDRGASN